MQIIWLTISAILPLAAIAAAQTISPASPLACDRSALTPAERKRHFDELGPALRGLVKNVRELRNGYEFELPADPATFRLAAEWAAVEHVCCPFFEIDLRQEREKGAFWMRLAGRSGVKRFIEADFGGWMRRAGKGG
jgi:hypothetical protein